MKAAPNEDSGDTVRTKLTTSSSSAERYADTKNLLSASVIVKSSSSQELDAVVAANRITTSGRNSYASSRDSLDLVVENNRDKMSPEAGSDSNMAAAAGDDDDDEIRRPEVERKPKVVVESEDKRILVGNESKDSSEMTTAEGRNADGVNEIRVERAGASGELVKSELRRDDDEGTVILSDDVTTQEIVLTVKLPRHLRLRSSAAFLERLTRHGDDDRTGIV